MGHRFNIDQGVDLLPNELRLAALGPYEIRHLVPTRDNDPDESRYRIKCDAEKDERIAPESDLTLSQGAFACLIVATHTCALRTINGACATSLWSDR